MPEVVGFTRPSLQTLIDRTVNDLNTRLPGTDARLRRSTLNVLARVMAGAQHLLYGFISFIAQQVIVDTAQREWLERHGSLWGVTRKAATAASGAVAFMGENGAVIPAGTRLSRADGEEFHVVTEATIASGTAVAPVVATTPGASQNTDEGVTLTLLASLPGIQATASINLPGLTGGTDTEPDAPFRARVLDRIQEPPHGGADFDYRKWALEVPGVTRAWVFPKELGLGTVTVRFVRDNDASLIPDDAEVEAVQDYINARRPVTAQVTVVAPVAVPLDFTIQIAPDTTVIREAIEAELRDFLRREAAPGATIYLSRINEAVSIATGEFDHTLTVPAANVDHAVGEMATMGTITWSTSS